MKRKYKIGTLLQHKQYGFVIQIKGGDEWKYVFEVVKGLMPYHLKPGFDYFTNETGKNDDLLYYYGYETLRTKFTIISGAGAEVLFGNRNNSDSK